MLVLGAATLGVHRCERGGEGDHEYVEQARNKQAAKLEQRQLSRHRNLNL